MPERACTACHGLGVTAISGAPFTDQQYRDQHFKGPRKTCGKCGGSGTVHIRKPKK